MIIIININANKMINFIDINDIKKVNQNSSENSEEKKKTCNSMNVDIDFLDNNESLKSASVNSLKDIKHCNPNVFYSYSIFL
jgi:GH18 family chitinase